jgi:hypothetical protein
MPRGVIGGGVPEFEFPGVFVEETGGKPKPVDGVPTNFGDGLSPADWTRLAYGIVIGGAAVAGLGLWLAMVWREAMTGFLVTPAGALGLIAILGSALVLVGLRALVEWRRRLAGRPPLGLGKVAFGVAAFRLVYLVAFGLCLMVVVASLLVARAWTLELLAATIALLIGCMWAWFAGCALRDLLLLVQAARDGT